MSRICEKCGNVIPDGMDSCPNCGREDYNEEVLRDVLNELGIPMDAEDGTEEERKTEDEAPPTYEETPTVTPTETEPAAGSTNSSGQVYVPGFGWIESQGSNQVEYAEDIYKN